MTRRARIDVSSVLTVAKKDYHDAIRSQALWALAGVFLIFMAGLAILMAESGLMGLFWPFFLSAFGDAVMGLRAVDFVGFFTGPAQIFVPIVAVVITHRAIAGEIEEGSAKFLLSVPISRREALFGKVVGRTLVMWSALVVGFAAAALVLVLNAGQFDLAPYFIGIGLTFLFGFAYVSIGVTVSSLTDTASRAITYAVAFYAVIDIFSTFFANIIYWLLNGTFYPPPLDAVGPSALDAPGWFFLIKRLSPSAAYNATMSQFVGSESPNFAANFPAGLPFYLSNWAAILTLLFWVVAPLVVGYFVFDRADIG